MFFNGTGWNYFNLFLFKRLSCIGFNYFPPKTYSDYIINVTPL